MHNERTDIMTEQAFRTVNTLRKSGKLKEAWGLGFTALEESPHDAYLKGALFWVCYEYIKLEQEKVIRRGISSNNYRPNDNEFRQLDSLIQTIVNMGIATGGLEYRMLLVQFKKNLEWFPSLINFILHHQGNLFTEEDRQPFQAEKGEVPSLMLSIARKIAAAWIRDNKIWTHGINPVLEFIKLTRQQVSDSKHLIWLDYDQSKCLIIAGRYDEARELLLPILRKKQKEAWAWGALAATYKKQDPVLALKFFAKGIASAHDIVFSLKLFQGIIPLLLANNKQAEASICLKLVLSIYQSNSWKLKPEFEQMAAQPWYDAAIDDALLNNYLTSISHDALDHILGPLEKVIGVVENIHQSGKGFRVYMNKSTSLEVRLGLHKDKQKPYAGQYVELTIKQNKAEKEVISSSSCSPIRLADISYIEGDLRVSPKGFGFIEDTFVPSYLLAEVENKTFAKALRVVSWDKNKDKYSYKAIKLEELR